MGGIRCQWQDLFCLLCQKLFGFIFHKKLVCLDLDHIDVSVLHPATKRQMRLFDVEYSILES
jgi:hypothetical protein